MKEKLTVLLSEYRPKFTKEFKKFLTSNGVSLEEEWTFEEFNCLVNAYNFEGVKYATFVLEDWRKNA